MSMQTRTTILTDRQRGVARDLAKALNIDGDRIRFLNPDKPEEPWLPPEALVTIARQSPRFKTLDEGYQEFIQQLRQVVHHATFIDVDGRTFGRCGVATIDEDADIDAHVIAAGRAISAALNTGGINPLRPGATVAPVDLGSLPLSSSADANELIARRGDLARIHILAKQKGLIIEGAGVNGAESTKKYKDQLEAWYGVRSAYGFSPEQRASLIEALSRLPDPDEFAELREEAL
jgi:hypothetical protein